MTSTVLASQSRTHSALVPSVQCMMKRHMDGGRRGPMAAWVQMNLALCRLVVVEVNAGSIIIADRKLVPCY